MRKRWIKLGFLVLAIALMLCPSQVSGAWADVNEGWQQATSNPVNASAFSAALTNPSIIIVGVKSTETTIATPTDTAGNTYVDCGAGLVLFNTSAYSIQLFYALNTHTTASNVISVVNTNGKGIAILAAEWTGGATSSPVNGTPASNPNASTGTGGGQNMTSTNTTPVVSGDLIIGWSWAVSGLIAVGTGFTGSTTGVTQYEYLVQAVAAAIPATWANNTNNAKYGAIVAAFKAYTAPSGRKLRVISD